MIQSYDQYSRDMDRAYGPRPSNNNSYMGVKLVNYYTATSSASEPPKGDWQSDKGGAPAPSLLFFKELADRYPTKELKELVSKTPPTDVDLTKKEMHLSDSQFKSVFGMGKGEFMALALWKQKRLKEDVKLF